MRNAPERLSKFPIGESVGAVPLMNYRKSGLHFRIGQIRIIREKLIGHKHSLVIDRLTRKRYNIKIIRLATEIFQNKPLYPLADKVKFSFKLITFELAAIDKNLPDARLGFKRYLSKTARANRHITPTDNDHTVIYYRLFKYRFASFADIFVFGSEDHSHAVCASFWKFKSKLASLAPEKFVGNLKQYPRAVTGYVIGTRGSAMMEIQQYLFGIFDNVVGLLAIDVDNRTDPAGIMLIFRLI
jgi:hypothetical protein